MRTSLVALVGLSLAACAITQRGDSAQPLTLPVSGFWEGNDGQWSTFYLQIGNPAQVVRLIPGTSATAANQIWVVVTEGCTQANPDLVAKDCAFDRGGLFDRNASLTWSTERLENGGLYGIDLYEESKLDLAANAYYGFDTISSGQPGSGLPTLQHQLIAGIATNDFFLGTLGLSPLSQNFTSYNSPVPSMLGTLRSPNNTLVPSTTWAYTSGAVYKDPPVFGSVTLGGYDANRIDLSKSISLPFWTDPSRDLLIGLQSITYDTFGSSPLLTQGIYIFIDSLVAQMWLPLDVCTAFEKAFGLQWDNVTEFYTVSQETHEQLLAQNPAFAFTIGPSKDHGSNNTVIHIPYAAFDLNVSTPYYNQSQRYFPLKRAQNDTQFTLGRAFLQEAYVIADYDRGNFTVGQALFPSTQDIRSILPPGLSVTKLHSGLSTGAIAGIAIGGVVLLVVVVAILWWWLRKPSRKHSYASALTDEKPPFEQEGQASHGTDHGGLGELGVDGQLRAMSELPAKHSYRASELSAASNAQELPGNHWYELSGEGITPELESSHSNQRR